MYKKTKMTPTVVKSEVNRIVDLIDAKLLHKEDMEKKRWEEAKKKALQKKRNAHRREVAKAKREEVAKAAKTDKSKDEVVPEKAPDDEEKDKEQTEADSQRSSRAPSTDSIRPLPDDQPGATVPKDRGSPQSQAQSETSKTSTVIDTEEKTSSGSGSSVANDNERDKSASKEKDSEESTEEVYVPRVSSKRQMPPPKDVKLPSAPRTRRLPGDPVDASTILSEVRTLTGRVGSLEDEIVSAKEVCCQ